MDNKSLELLEFPQVREILAGFTSFPASRELALGLQPLSDYDQISLLLRQSAEARELLSFEPGFSIGDVKDVREMAKLVFDDYRELNTQGSLKRECPKCKTEREWSLGTVDVSLKDAKPGPVDPALGADHALEEIIARAAKERKLLSDIGVPWAVRTKAFPLKGYKRFEI